MPAATQATTAPATSVSATSVPPGGYIEQTWVKIHAMGQEFFRLLPGLVMGPIILIGFIFLARLARSLVSKAAFDQKRHPHLALVLSRLAYGVTLILGILFAATAAFPSFTPAGLFASLG